MIYIKQYISYIEKTRKTLTHKRYTIFTLSKMADSNDNSSNTNIEITEDTKIENNEITEDSNSDSIKQNPE